MSLKIYGINKAKPDTKHFISEIETEYDKLEYAHSTIQKAHIMDKVVKLMPNEMEGDCVIYVEGAGFHYNFEVACFHQ